MTQPPDITAQRQSQLLSQLGALAAERAEVERTLSGTRVARQNAANSSFQSLRAAEVRRNGETLDRLTKERSHAESEVERPAGRTLADLEAQELQLKRSAPRLLQELLEKIQHHCDRGVQKSQRQLAEATRDLKKQWLAFEQGWGGVQQQHDATAAQLQAESARRRFKPSEADAEPEDTDSWEAAATEAAGASTPPLDRTLAALAQIRSILERLRSKPSAKFFDEGWTVLLVIFTGLAAIYPAGRLLGWSNWLWAPAALGAAVAVALAARLFCRWRLKRHTAELLPAAHRQLALSAASLSQAWGDATKEAEAKRSQLKARHRKHSQQLQDQREQKQRETKAKHEADTAATLQRLAAEKADVKRRAAEQLQQLADKYDPLLADEKARHQQAMDKLCEDNRAELERSQRAYDEGMTQLVHRWTDHLAKFHAAIAEMNDYCRSRFPAWSEIDWDRWTPAATPAAAFPYGRYLVDLDQYGEPPEDARLRLDESRLELPAALAFPQRPSLLLEASDDGKQAAVDVIRTLMLRLLMGVPPGKVRFTIVDAEALGQSFSAFMHLSDYDEQIVGPRIWTEGSHIQQQLADLTEHTENVIQKYLRNQFASIQEYNEHAGEVAEPYRILVVANFPTGFTEEASRRLVRIASTGAKCGVFTLISIDTRKKLPREFFIDELESHATTLQWTHTGFRPKDPALRSLPLAIDPPPSDDEFTRAIHVIGRHVQDADRVEVPFQMVAPAGDALWQSDCGEELDVALGRAGATKLQHLRLGRGVSQHVLMAGKTGSGKSTLLHALIVNVALHYSPEQVEFYLIDFKKGVEFKPYAAQGLPHARVIAIESEREFGMSVLERLDSELKRRGDLFRDAGAQDVQGFRSARPDEPLPRVLLIIDEFQELFVKDDKLASDASLLLDRLVRQGRAFGMHVLLGSQTLAGGYSLPRSTIGQMAVRIALQCSESDAHLILSEDNTAARLLTRPGEAIYNNANGRFEGNSPFQVAYLSDGERVERLQRIAAMAEQQGTRMPPPIVFEGNVPADPLRTPALLEDLRSGVAVVPRLWLGSAVAIKPPTALEFPRQPGANLLVVGAQEDMAAGVLANGAICLAASQAASSHDGAPAATVTVLDGTRGESPLAGLWRRAADACPGIQLADVRGAAAAVAELAAELDRREQGQDESSPARFLVVHNLSRFRDLRRGEDDFSFSTFGGDSDEKSGDAQPQKLLQRLLREGPTWGLHVLVWADSHNTASRWFDRATMKDFERRVLFQMTAGDSANLIDSPAASQLGVHRAILYSEEQASQEKFRPFAPPSPEWLRRVRELSIGPEGTVGTK